MLRLKSLLPAWSATDLPWMLDRKRGVRSFGTMQFLVQHQDQRLGPFTLDQVRTELAAGRIALSDLCWWEGEPLWKPLSQVPGLASGIPGAAGVPASPGDGSALCVWSLVLGLLAVIGCVCLSGIPAVICGHMALARKSRAGVQEGRGLAIAGLVTGYLGIALTLVAVAIGSAVAIPAVNAARSQEKLIESVSNARRISLACEMYKASNDGEFPDSLEELVAAGLLNGASLIDPLAPEQGANGYTYLKPSPDDSPETVILVGKGQAQNGKRAVGRRNGEVRSEKYTLPPDL